VPGLVKCWPWKGPFYWNDVGSRWLFYDAGVSNDRRPLVTDLKLSSPGYSRHGYEYRWAAYRRRMVELQVGVGLYRSAAILSSVGLRALLAAVGIVVELWSVVGNRTMFWSRGAALSSSGSSRWCRCGSGLLLSEFLTSC